VQQVRFLTYLFVHVSFLLLQALKRYTRSGSANHPQDVLQTLTSLPQLKTSLAGWAPCVASVVPGPAFQLPAVVLTGDGHVQHCTLLEETRLFERKLTNYTREIQNSEARCPFLCVFSYLYIEYR